MGNDGGGGSGGGGSGGGGDGEGDDEDETTQTTLGGTNEETEWENRDRNVKEDEDNDEKQIGDAVEDADDANPSAAVVVGKPDENADEYEFQEGTTVADVNDDYDADDNVLEVVFKDNLDDEIPDWENMTEDELAQAVKDADLNKFAYPESRMTDPSMQTGMPEGFGVNDLAQNLEELGYEDIADDLTYDPPEGLEKRPVDAEEVAKDMEFIGTQQMPGEDKTVMETLVEDYDEYDSPQDVIADAIESRDKPWVNTAPVDENFDGNYDQKREMADNRWQAVEGGETAHNVPNIDDVETVVISDSTDTDGSMSMMLYEEEHGDDALVLPSGHKGWQEEKGQNLEKGLQRVLENSDADTNVVIADLSPNDTEEFANVVNEHGGQNEIYIRDHHNWDDSALDSVREANIQAGVENPDSEHIVLDGNANAAAELVYEHDVNSESLSSSFDDISDSEYQQNIEEAVEMTSLVDSRADDHENWEDASAYRSLQFRGTHEDFVEQAGRHGSAYRTDSEMSRASLQADLISDIQMATSAETRRTTTVDVGGEELTFEARMTGNGDYNRAADFAFERGADVVAVVKGGSGDRLESARGDVSFRATDDYPIASALASENGGGGREDGRAGGTDEFDISGAYDSLPDDESTYFAHQNSGGQPVLDKVMENVPEQIRETVKDD